MNFRGDIGRPVDPEEPNRCITHRRHDFRAGSFANSARVLSEGDITNAVGSMVIRPVARTQSKQLAGTS